MEIFIKDKLLRDFFVRENLILFWDKLKREQNYFKIKNLFVCFQKLTDKFEICFSEEKFDTEKPIIDINKSEICTNSKVFHFFKQLNFERKYCFDQFYHREYKHEFVLVRLCHFLSVEICNLLTAMGYSRKQLDLALDLKELHDRQLNYDFRPYKFTRWTFKLQLYDFLMYETYNALNESLYFLESLERCKFLSEKHMSDEEFLIMINNSNVLHNQLLQFQIGSIIEKIGKINLLNLF